MAKSDEVVVATFPRIGLATAAIDWFRNQAIEPDAIQVWAVPPGGRARPPQRGDNARADLAWIVSLDLSRARMDKRQAVEAMRRQGGVMLARPPDAS